MKGINYLTDDQGNKTVLLIDLKSHDKKLNELLEDIEDIMQAEAVKDEPTVTFEKAISNLYAKGKVSKKVYEKVTARNV